MTDMDKKADELEAMLMEPALRDAGLSVVSSDPAAVAAAAKEKTRIEAAYTMAIHRPRSEDMSRLRILQACNRPMFAEMVEYRKPVGGGKSIVGLSIRFAEQALRCWGNIQTDVTTIYEDDDIRRVKVIITDMETNTAFSKEVNITKTVERHSRAGREVVGERINSGGGKVFVVRATDDELNNKESALISKALRTEGLRLIPQDIKEEAIERARRTMQERDVKDPEGERRKLLDAFAEIGVKPADIDGYLGHSTQQLAPAELQDLRSIYRTIRDGEAKWADYVTIETTAQPVRASAAPKRAPEQEQN